MRIIRPGGGGPAAEETVTKANAALNRPEACRIRAFLGCSVAVTPRVLFMTDTVADLNQVKIAMLRRLAAEPKARAEDAHWDTGDDGLTRHTLGTLHPEVQNRVGPGEQK